MMYPDAKQQQGAGETRPVEKQILPAFPTFIGRFRYPDAAGVNQELKEAVLARMKAEPNVPHANIGGWHSRTDLLEWAAPAAAIARLRGWITDAVNGMVGASVEQARAAGINRPFNGGLQVHAWANVSRKGSYHGVHNHPGACWSGVYYVDSGGPAPAEHPMSGIIDLHDPRQFAEMAYTPGEPYGHKFQFRPEPGTMLVFPGFLYHFVHPYMGEGERISIAFNTRAVKV